MDDADKYQTNMSETQPTRRDVIDRIDQLEENISPTIEITGYHEDSSLNIVNIQVEYGYISEYFLQECGLRIVGFHSIDSSIDLRIDDD